MAKSKAGGYTIGGALTKSQSKVVKQTMKVKNKKPTLSKLKGKKGKKFNSSKYEATRKKVFGMK